MALAPVFAPAAVGVFGFGAGGVAAGEWLASHHIMNGRCYLPLVNIGSVAAGIQAGIGNVVAGSLFAGAQSVAAGGALPVVGSVIAGGVGAVTGFFVGR